MIELNKLISIAIPCYEMNGFGASFLNDSLTKIYNQTYKNIQVVVSDHSINNDIKEICDKWSDKLLIKYLKNKNNIGSSSSNINFAINNSDGDIIKILFQDDFLHNEYSIELIVNFFDENDKWLITSCLHTNDGINMFNEHHPKWNDKIHLGINTISSPSVLSIKNDVKERFDDDLIWLMDCDMYKKLYDSYGPPKILPSVNVVNRLWGNRLSDTIPQSIKDNELIKMKLKYK
jgi:glycosyltransferase involved in cell wall biosynthesis